MKRKFISIAAVTALFLSVLVTACSKDGATGPAGPAGANGPAGPTGPQGAQGNAGTANVIYSDWLDVAYLPDTIHTAGNGIDTIGFYATINAPKMTADILNKGEVKIYFNLNNSTDPSIWAIPYFNPYNNITINLEGLEVGKIYLYSNLNPGTITQAGVKYQQYRYVLIPGGTPARTATGSSINWNNYSEVKAYLGLKD